MATLTLQLRRRIDDRTREDASDDPLWPLIRRRPNRWQTPSQFRRMMQAHLRLRGNACAMIVRSRGVVRKLIPLQPDRVACRQRDDRNWSTSTPGATVWACGLASPRSSTSSA